MVSSKITLIIKTVTFLQKHNYIHTFFHDSQFVKLAESVIVSTTCTGSSTDDEQGNYCMELQQHFPDFIWLLRDAHLKPTGDDGMEISPTNYLLTKVLCRGTQFNETEADIVGRTIFTVFPSIECKTMQIPSSDCAVMQNRAADLRKLDPMFNKEVEELIEYLYGSVKPKRGFAAGTLVDGVTLSHNMFLLLTNQMLFHALEIHGWLQSRTVVKIAFSKW